jgi:hypothetical protein
MHAPPPLALLTLGRHRHGRQPHRHPLFTADPAARVFGDRLYVYTSHDEKDATYFDMFDWRLFSTADLATWQDHGSIFGLKGFAWAEKWAWAPDAVHANGKYYLFLPTDRARIGVAVGDSPQRPVPRRHRPPASRQGADARGRPRANRSRHLLDDDGPGRTCTLDAFPEGL